MKPVNKTQRRKTYICAPEDVLLLIINNIHNLSFLFSGLLMCLCKINVVILLHSVELLILFHHTSFQRMELILVYFDKWLSSYIIDLHYIHNN